MSTKKEPLWKNCWLFFHGIHAVEIDHRIDKPGFLVVEILFKNTAGQEGQISLFLDELATVKWTKKKKFSLDAIVPGRIIFKRKKPKE